MKEVADEKEEKGEQEEWVKEIEYRRKRRNG